MNLVISITEYNNIQLLTHTIILRDKINSDRHYLLITINKPIFSGHISIGLNALGGKRGRFPFFLNKY